MTEADEVIRQLRGDHRRVGQPGMDGRPSPARVLHRPDRVQLRGQRHGHEPAAPASSRPSSPSATSRPSRPPSAPSPGWRPGPCAGCPRSTRPARHGHRPPPDELSGPRPRKASAPPTRAAGPSTRQPVRPAPPQQTASGASPFSLRRPPDGHRARRQLRRHGHVLRPVDAHRRVQRGGLAVRPEHHRLQGGRGLRLQREPYVRTGIVQKVLGL